MGRHHGVVGVFRQKEAVSRARTTPTHTNKKDSTEQLVLFIFYYGIWGKAGEDLSSKHYQNTLTPLPVKGIQYGYPFV